MNDLEWTTCRVCGDEYRKSDIDDENHCKPMTTPAAREWHIPKIDFANYYDVAGKYKKPSEDKIHVVEASALKEKDEELEKLRMQLAGCGVAAMQNTRDSVKDRITTDNPYWSASYGDVCNAVDSEIALREENARLRELLSEISNSIVRPVSMTDAELQLSKIEERCDKALSGGADE
jgi:hypothetical protein